jgi:hypothetical protein
MGLSLGQMRDWIVEELSRCRPVSDSMASLIDSCETASPHPDWAKLRAVPYGDLSSLLEWLLLPFRVEPPTMPLKGLWFGLFEACYGRVTGTDIYFCGSERFDPDPKDKEWAVGPDWWPENRYARSDVLAKIYHIAHRRDLKPWERKGCLGNDAEYPLCLGYGAFAVRELLGQVDPSLLLGQSDSLGVAVGFDSGDFVLLGRFVLDGLAPIGE